MLAFGTRLVRELGIDPGVDTLGRWIAHHIAELIHTAENAPPESQAEASRAAVQTVFELWDHRASVDRIDPLRDLKPILNVIKTLDPDEPYWRLSAHDGRPGVRQVYSALRQIVVFSLLDSFVLGPVDRTNFEGTDEAAIIDALNLWLSERQKAVLSEADKPSRTQRMKKGLSTNEGVESTTDILLRQIGDARIGLDALERELRGEPPVSPADLYAASLRIEDDIT